MTKFEGDIVEYDRMTDYAMYISDENDVFQNLYVSTKNLDENINSTTISAYSYDPGSLHKQCNSNFYKDFANALSLRG